jgi:hypothetical protein
VEAFVWTYDKKKRWSGIGSNESCMGHHVETKYPEQGEIFSLEGVAWCSPWYGHLGRAAYKGVSSMSNM